MQCRTQETSESKPEAEDERTVRKKKTEMLWRELIDTESNYVNNLDIIIKVACARTPRRERR